MAVIDQERTILANIKTATNNPADFFRLNPIAGWAVFPSVFNLGTELQRINTDIIAQINSRDTEITPPLTAPHRVEKGLTALNKLHEEIETLHTQFNAVPAAERDGHYHRMLMDTEKLGQALKTGRDALIDPSIEAARAAERAALRRIRRDINTFTSTTPPATYDAQTWAEYENFLREIRKEIEDRLTAQAPLPPPAAGAPANPPYNIAEGIIFLKSLEERFSQKETELTAKIGQAYHDASHSPFPAERARAAKEYNTLYDIHNTINYQILRTARDSQTRLNEINTAVEAARPPAPVAAPEGFGKKVWNGFKNAAFEVGRNWKEIAIGVATGASVRLVFVVAAAAFALPMASTMAVGGLVAGGITGLVRAKRASHLAGGTFTKKDAAKAFFKGTAFAAIGGIIGYELVSLIPTDAIHHALQSVGLESTPAPGTGIGTRPPSHIFPPGETSPGPGTTPPPPIPDAPGSISGAGDLRAEIMRHVNAGEFDKFTSVDGHNLRKEITDALGTTAGKENWKYAAARIADAGYCDFNGYYGAAHDMTTRKLGAGFYGLANRIADAAKLHNPLSESIGRSTKWLSGLAQFKNSLAATPA